MRAKIAGLVFAFFLCFSFCPDCFAQESGYFTQMGKTFTRGVKNMVSFPWEVPVTVKEYDQKTDGNPRAYRDVAGFVDGTFRAITRFGCGVWDVVFSLVPGQQDSLPLKPESFF